MAMDVNRAKTLLKNLDDAKAGLKEMGGVKLAREYVTLSASKDRMAEIEAKVEADKTAGTDPVKE